MQKKNKSGKIKNVTSNSVLFKIFSQPLRDIIVFSFPVPGFTPIRQLECSLFVRESLGFLCVYMRFLKDSSMYEGNYSQNLERIVSIPAVELE